MSQGSFRCSKLLLLAAAAAFVAPKSLVVAV